MIEVRGGPASAARRVNAFGFVFQEPALLSWRTAIGNVRLPLEVVGYPPEKRNARCEELLNSVGLLKFKDAYPHELSGGMKQRVAIVRALAWNPSILLMDEPFSALDYQTRNRMRRELAATLAERPRTVVFVTHDIEEAVQLGDRVVVLGARPARVRRVLELPPGRPRLPATPGVPEAEQAIMEELGLH
jgi:NitT/TauT family transport system ATP-binding protein